MIPLPEAFLRVPIAHRAYHDLGAGRPENSQAAIRAAISAGYGIEIDIQPSADGVPMVFHDYTLERLTDETGPIALRDASALASTQLKGAVEGIPTLREVLSLIGGQVPLLIEIKDQDGAMGENVGALEDAVARDLAGYSGPVAVMSFNPHSVAAVAEAAPNLPRGLTTSRYSAHHYPTLRSEVRRRLRQIPDLERVGASFISHEARDLDSPHVAHVKASGLPILCWTIRSPEAETKAREVADNITFEGYPAPMPA